MKRPYETCVLFDGTLSDEAVAKEQQAIEQLLTQDSELEKVEPWGRRTLAYEIRKKKTGVYFLFKYRSEGDVPARLDKRLKLNQNVLRFLTLRRDPRFEDKIIPVEPALQESGKEEEAGDERTNG